MRMIAEDIKTFPKFSKYVSISLPGMANVKSIISAIESISEFGDTAAIKAALSWGHGPMVEVKILWTSSRQTGGESQGRVYSAHKYNHNPPTRRFGLRKWQGFAEDSQRPTVHVVGAQLLHELTHWAREQAGKSEDEDLGFVFEKEIYGGIVTD